MTIKIEAAQRLKAATIPKWMRQMAGGLGNLPAFSPGRAEELLRSGKKGIEIDDERADKMINTLKKDGYKIVKVGRDIVRYVGRGGDYGIQFTYGKGEDVRITFYDDQEDDEDD